MSERSALIVGGGGREHALAQSLIPSIEDDELDKIFVAPGNAGTGAMDNVTNLPIGATDYYDIVEFASELKPVLTIIGPEQPLVDGLADRLEAYGLTVFGPTAKTAWLEGSKARAARFMTEFNIPQPKYVIIDRNPLRESVRKNFLKGCNPQNYVLKADGLAAGKGVALPNSCNEVINILDGMYSGELFEGAGKNCVVMQERLHGPELSVIVICDGKGNYTSLPFAQDHKRLKDNDEGPNTGGMGSYSPLPNSMLSLRQQEKIQRAIFKTIDGTDKMKTPFKGALYFGFMLAEERGGDPVVIEFNVRFGDPEAQVILERLRRTGVDIYDLLLSAAKGNLRPGLIPKIGGAALTVCLAAEGYPDNPKKGDEIFGLDKSYQNVTIQHGGTKIESDKVLTTGGRVLYITGYGQSVDEAAASAYHTIGESGIYFRGMQYRKDIGWQARDK